MRSELLFSHEKSRFAQDRWEDWNRKLLRIIFGPFESVERTSLGHFAYREVQVETTVGGSSRQERIGFVVFWDVNDLKVEEDPPWPRPSVRKELWKREQQQTAWREHIFKVQRWKQVTGPAGAVMREARDLGHNMPYLVV